MEEELRKAEGGDEETLVVRQPSSVFVQKGSNKKHIRVDRLLYQIEIPDLLI